MSGIRLSIRVWDLPIRLFHWAVVVLLIVYHFYCGRLLATFERGENRRTHKWYRMFNELPVLGMLAAVALVVLKPF